MAVRAQGPEASRGEARDKAAERTGISPRSVARGTTIGRKTRATYHVCALRLNDPRDLFVFDPATYDPLAPDDLGQSGIESLLAPTSRRLTGWLKAPHLCATVYLPPDRFAPDLQQRLHAALTAHCAQQIARSRRDQAEALVQNAVRLVAGVAIVLLAIALQNQMSTSKLPSGDVLKQALELGIGMLTWVTLWTPVEALATDWYAFVRLRRGYRTLLGMALAVKRA